MTRSKTPTAIGRAIAALRGNIALVVFFSFFINMLILVAPLYMLQVYDRVLVSQSVSTLLALTAIALGLLVVYGLLEFVRSRILVRSGLKFDEHMNQTVFRAIFRSSVQSNRDSSAQALRDMDMVREFISGGAIVAFCDAPWVPVFVAAGFLLHPALGLISLGGAIIIFLLAVLNEMSTRSMLQEGGAVGLRATNEAATSLRNAEIVQALGMISSVMNRWNRRHDESLGYQSRASDRAGAILASSRFMRLILQIAILGAGAYLALEGEITPGVMIAASIIMGRALGPVEMAVGQWKTFAASRSAYRRLDELLSSQPPTPDRMRLPDPTGRIAVESISVLPPGARTLAVKNVSIDLKPGTALGIVGPSGSGKSSLARALVGAWPIVAGKIAYDGAELSQWDPEELGPHLGYIPQDVELFSGTIAENISRFQEVDPDAVVDAARKAGVHDLIVSLPDGYNTHVGDGGQALSGGQRQRIALARALYGDPKVLVLDEPNANLDTEGEQALVKAMYQTKQEGRTLILITHRGPLLSVVDRIAVLRDGALARIDERDAVMAELARPLQPPGQPPGQPPSQPGTLTAKASIGRSSIAE